VLRRDGTVVREVDVAVFGLEDEDVDLVAGSGFEAFLNRSIWTTCLLLAPVKFLAAFRLFCSGLFSFWLGNTCRMLLVLF